MKKATAMQTRNGDTDRSRHLGGFTISRVITECTEVRVGGDDGPRTLGQMLDARLATAIREGHTIQDVSFHFDPTNSSHLSELRDMYEDLHFPAY